jgi:hypothetical protein
MLRISPHFCIVLPLRPSHGNIHLEPVFDDVNNRYALMQFGWDRERQVRGNIIYVSIKNNKVLIEYDGVKSGITSDRPLIPYPLIP